MAAAQGAAAAAPNIPAALGVLGLAMASTAATLAAGEPPLGLADGHAAAYFLALWVLLLAGVVQVQVSASVLLYEYRDGDDVVVPTAAKKLLIRASIPAVAVAVALSVLPLPW